MAYYFKQALLLSKFLHFKWARGKIMAVRAREGNVHAGR